MTEQTRGGAPAGPGHGAPRAGPEITVVIPTHERREILLKVLDALGVQTVSTDRYEVVVVCDGCPGC